MKDPRKTLQKVTYVFVCGVFLFSALASAGEIPYQNLAAQLISRYPSRQVVLKSLAERLHEISRPSRLNIKLKRALTDDSEREGQRDDDTLQVPPKDEHIWSLVSELLKQNNIGLAIQKEFDLDRELEYVLKEKYPSGMKLDVGIRTFNADYPGALTTAVRSLRNHGKTNVLILMLDGDGAPQDIQSSPELFEDSLLFNFASAGNNIKGDNNAYFTYQTRIIMSMFIAAAAKDDENPVTRDIKIEILKYLVRPYMRDDSKDAMQDFLDNLFAKNKNVFERFSGMVGNLLSARPARSFNKDDEIRTMQHFWKFV